MSSTSPIVSARRVALRACTMRLLSCALAYPERGRVEGLDACLEAAVAQSDGLPVRVLSAVRGLSAVRSGLSLEAIELAYVAFFGHVCRADCNPCEISYRARHVFQAAQNMADIQGFYRAFGLEVGRERPDHASVEWEFMAFLTYRESHALADGQLENAGVMRAASATFLGEHLGKWGRLLAYQMKRRAPDGWFAAVATLMDVVLRIEGQRLGVRIVRPQQGALTSADRPGSSPLRSAERPQETVFYD